MLSVGAALVVGDAWTVRAGFNHAENPVPDTYLNPLFPATVEQHVTGGLSFAPTASDAIDLSVAVAPEVTDTNGDGIRIDHSQLNAQLTYRHSF